MLKKHYRISRTEWPTVTNQVRLVRSAHISFKYKAFSSLKASVVVSKKVEKTSVGRHALKRYIYNRFNEIIGKNYAVVAFVTKKPLQLSDLDTEMNDFISTYLV